MRRPYFLIFAAVMVLFVMPVVISAQNHGKRYAYGRHHISLLGRHDKGLHRGWYVGKHKGWIKNEHTPPAMTRTTIGIGRGRGRGHGRGPRF